MGETEMRRTIDSKIDEIMNVCNGLFKHIELQNYTEQEMRFKIVDMIAITTFR